MAWDGLVHAPGFFAAKFQDWSPGGLGDCPPSWTDTPTRATATVRLRLNRELGIVTRRSPERVAQGRGAGGSDGANDAGGWRGA